MWGRLGRRRTALLPEPWMHDQDAGWVRYFPDKTAPTHRVEVVGPVPNRGGWDFTVYEYGDGDPEAVCGGSRASLDGAAAAGVEFVDRLQTLDASDPSIAQRDNLGNLKVKPESLQQRRLRVAEQAVVVAKAELREKEQLGAYSTSYAVIERARLAVEQAKLEVETIKAEPPEITYNFTVQDPEDVMAAIKERAEKQSDPRGRARRIRTGGR